LFSGEKKINTVRAVSFGWGGRWRRRRRRGLLKTGTNIDCNFDFPIQPNAIFVRMA